MVRQNSGQQAYEDPNLFAGGGIGAEGSHPLKRRIWLHIFLLFLSQPLLMLGGMWALLVLIASIAFGGLLDPGVNDLSRLPPLEQSNSSENKWSPSQKSIQTDTQLSGPTQTQPPIASNSNQSQNQVDINQPSDISGPSIPVWSLGGLVLTCVAGCWVINHYLNAPPSPPVKTLRQPKPLKTPRENKPAPRTLKRLKPFDSSTENVLPKTGQVQRTPAPVAKANSPESLSSSTKPVVAAVVPPNESNPLDWPEGSLAHQLDLRQQKSLSSWL